jgi:hypothetical protein
MICNESDRLCYDGEEPPSPDPVNFESAGYFVNDLTLLF